MPSASYSRPVAGEYPPYFEAYLREVQEADPIAVMTAQISEVTAFFRGLPPGKADFAYAPDKWTVKEIIGHLADTERVMTYRALRVGRGDQTPLPGFDENAWMAPAQFRSRTLDSLVDEWIAVRRATISLFSSLPAGARLAVGTANNQPISVRTLAFVIPGHVRHHLRMVRERYL
jgi:hypothetical protein